MTTQRYNLPTTDKIEVVADNTNQSGGAAVAAAATTVTASSNRQVVVQSSTILPPVDNGDNDQDPLKGVDNSPADEAAGKVHTPPMSSGDSSVDRKLLLNNSSPKNVDLGLAENHFCGPTMARNLFWNVTQAGDINVQPCPGNLKCFSLSENQCFDSNF